MVIVQTLAAREPGQEAPVGRGVVEVPGAAAVAQCVDEGRDNEHVQNGMQESRNDAGPEAEAEDAVGEGHPMEPIRPEVRGKHLEGLLVARLAHVVGDVEQLDTPEAQEPGAVWVTLAVCEGMVLAMNGDPFPPGLT